MIDIEIREQVRAASKFQSIGALHRYVGRYQAPGMPSRGEQIEFGEEEFIVIDRRLCLSETGGERLLILTVLPANSTRLEERNQIVHWLRKRYASSAVAAKIVQEIEEGLHWLEADFPEKTDSVPASWTQLVCSKHPEGGVLTRGSSNDCQVCGEAVDTPFRDTLKC